MFVLVVGGGKVGYYLTKELIERGHEVVLMEKDRGARGPDRRRDRLDRRRPRRLRGQVPRRGRRQPGGHRGRGHRRRRGQPRDLPDGQAPLRRPADDRPGQQPQERGAVPPPRRRRDHQPDADGPRLDRAGHPGPRAAAPRGAREGELEIIEAHLQEGSPAIGRRAAISIPEACSLFAVVRDGKAAKPLRPGHVLREGDKVIAIGRADCEIPLHAQLIGDHENGAG